MKTGYKYGYEEYDEYGVYISIWNMKNDYDLRLVC